MILLGLPLAQSRNRLDKVRMALVKKAGLAQSRNKLGGVTVVQPRERERERVVQAFRWLHLTSKNLVISKKPTFSSVSGITSLIT